jgi:maltooligosyltrehalose trehalohydrolase
MTRDLLRLRREDPVLKMQRPRGVDGAVLAPYAFALRFFAESGHQDDRLLIVNLGRDLPLRIAPEPLLAPPEGMRWTIAWSSDDSRYGGQGIAPVATDEGLRLPGEAAVLLIGART